MIGVMQGRLVPPENGQFQSHPALWRDEFPKAKEAGVDFIEWIVDSHPNPIFQADGLFEIDRLQRRYGIPTPSVCADWFMIHLLKNDYFAWKASLYRILVRAWAIGAKRVILPFVDNSSIDDEDLVVHALEHVGVDEVEIHLETDLPPARFAALLERLPNIYANWDSGNSSGLGYAASEEFAAYGDRIGSIHIKDRTREKKTMPLGQGDADFEDVFKAIRSVNYQGDITLQVARGEDGDEVNWIREQANFVRERLR